LLFLGENAFLLEGVLLRKCIIYSILGILMATKDTDDRPVVEQLPAGGETVNKDISRQRRKIIKASAAVVPAIMTLRSGAAAAMNSSYQCFNHGADAPNVDVVIADPDPPHDEWLRVLAVPGYVVTGSNDIKYYGVKNDNTSWIDVEDWTWWYIDPEVSSTEAQEGIDGGNVPGVIRNGWDDNKLAIYCITAEIPTVCWDENGVDITDSIPFDIRVHKIEVSETLVKLLAYYNQVTGITTYYPMDQGGVNQPITESCMCSIRPVSQLLDI
jgi:hypothetical protein